MDKARLVEAWKEGERVLLSTRHMRTFAMHLPMKLKQRWVGPFLISKVISPVAYRLELPVGWQIHPTFHASHLKAYIRHPKFKWEVEPPPLVLVDGELEYEVEANTLSSWQGSPM